MGVLISNLDSEQLAGALVAVINLLYDGDEAKMVAYVNQLTNSPFDKAPIN